MFLFCWKQKKPGQGIIPLFYLWDVSIDPILQDLCSAHYSRPWLQNVHKKIS
jgi:hypothetical protein